MIRIAEGIWPKEVKERDFFTPSGEYRVDDQATETMKNSLLYKMSYYKFADMFPPGKAVDRVRNTGVASPGPVLDTLEEVFTSETWIVRIYKVREQDNLGRKHGVARAFERGERRNRRSSARAKRQRNLRLA